MVVIIENLLNGFKEIFTAPLEDLSILWLLTPIILFWLIIEIYFGRHKKEKLGWNTALGNGLSMFWIVVISLKALLDKNLDLFSTTKLIFIIVITIYAVFIIFISFTHRLKEKIFFLFTSPTIVYFLFGVTLLLIDDLLKINFWVFIDLIILYIIILILETILKKFVPAASENPVGNIGNTGMGDIGKGFGKL